MIDSLLNHIKQNLLTNNPKTFQKGYAGARQYQDGKIVIYDNYEGEYVGLQDTKSNYFYIRYLENFELDAAEETRSISCRELTGTAPLRLVAWVNRANISKLCEVLLQDIMTTDFSTMSTADKKRFSDIKIFFSGMVLDPEQIFKDETGGENEDVKLAKEVVLVAIDFGIQFNYKTKDESITDCLDRNVCVGCD